MARGPYEAGFYLDPLYFTYGMDVVEQVLVLKYCKSYIMLLPGDVFF